MQVPLKRMLRYFSQIRQQSQRTYCTCLISFILVTQAFLVKSQGTYYVFPSSSNRSGWCSICNQHPCFNLTEVATVMISERSTSNISLILAPGNHTLLSNLTIAGHTHFLMKSENLQQSAIINCGESSQILMHSSTYIHLHDITLNGCVENEVKAVKNLTIEDSTFSAIGTTNVSGRALIVTSSTVIIVQSTFKYFSTPMTPKPRDQGGVILTIQSNVLISNSMFFMNQAGKGGVVYSLGSTVLINNSTFTKNSAKQGGVLYIENNGNATNHHLFQDYVMTNVTLLSEGSVSCISSNFIMNKALKGGVIYSVAQTSGSCILHLDQSNFEFNNASFGAVFEVRYSNATIHNCSFQYNKANQTGGVGYCYQSKLLIKESVFCYNRAEEHGGALYVGKLAKAVIDSGRFHNNIAAEKTGSSLQVHRKGNVILTGTISFEQGLAHYNATINIYDSNITFNGSINIINSSGSISFTHSTGHFAGYTLLKNNKGPIHLHDSKVVISGHLTSFKQESHSILEGGCISLFLTSMIVTGRVILNDSIATNGGGIRSISSRIFVSVRGTLIVTNNIAKDTGGGIYFYHSLLRAHGLVLIQGNKANTFGGGIHCITSTIVLIQDQHSQYIKLANNEAVYGGGICLEASSKFYMKHLPGATNEAVKYIENSAHYGGAIYVADNTTTGTCAAGSKVQTVTTFLKSECFFQILKPVTETENHYPLIEDYMNFTQNHAKISGENLYGGLLDRCTVYRSGKTQQYSNIAETVLAGTTSDPVRVCHCVSEYNSTVPDCTHSPSTLHVIKGYHSILTIKLAAVDHVNRKVNATIISSLERRKGHLGEGQQKQVIGATCTKLNFSVISPIQDYDHLILYADGPCKDLGISALRICIKFDPCNCPTGFEPESEIRDRCICRCHRVLINIFPYIECNSKTLLVGRNHDFWLSTTKKAVVQYFLTYKQCPSDYCHSSSTSVFINLNTSHGSDAQCAFNRTGVLCGSCEPNLTLSLGSSCCIECPHLWPALTIAILVGAFLAGLALVAIILVLNLTVASGTLNGVIFYANIITIDQQLFMPFERPNFHSVFIAWLNLDVGFDVCFFKGLNTYAKAWLQLTFPVYIILIVVTVVIVSHYSKRFANLVSRKNPVATLATLVLLSYAKLLHNIIEILSYAILHYTAEDESDSFTEVVWLRDGSIAYLKGAHVPLFTVAVLIIIVGSIYTLLLLSWQWLVKLSNKTLFCWVRNTKLSSFMDAYHAPYTARNRYWTGLLLLARVILYLTAAINVSGEPSVNLLAILLVIGCILLLHAYSGISIYKKWPLNVLEFTTYFNILAFTAVKFYIQMVGGNHAAITYASISVHFALFICSLLHHVVLECHILDKAKQTMCRYKSRFDQNLSTPLLNNDVQYAPPNQTVTYSEVMIKKPEIQLTSGVDSEGEGFSLLFSSTDNSQV